MLWNYLGRRGRNPSYAVKFVLANLLLALSFFVLIGSSLQSADNGQAPLALVSFAIIVMSIAEFPLQPIGLSMVTRLAPAQLIGAMVGLWLFGGAIANAIGGNVGALASTYGLPTVFAGMAIACVLTGLVLWLIRRMLSNWMALEEDQLAPAGHKAQMSAT
jgi:POT family proton-dependent oligopeptide transporter